MILKSGSEGERSGKLKIITYNFPKHWNNMEIFSLSDLHIGDPRVDIKLFRNFVQMIKEQPNRYVIYNGDNLNNAIKTSVSNVYNETMNPNEQRKWLAAELELIRDRFLCFVCGNHEYRSKKEVDISPVEWLAEKLGCPHYYEDEAALKISLGQGENGKRITYGLYVTHGAGGGRYVGSAINNVENLALTIEGADVVIVGHVHKKAASKPSVRVMDLHNNKVTEKDKLCVISSHWSDFGGYAARKMLRPSSKGSVPIILDGRKKYAYAII